MVTSIFDLIVGISPIAGFVTLIVAVPGGFYFYVLLRPARDYEGHSDEAEANREAYAARRTNLATGKTFVAWYDGLLESALDRVDRFFGDEPGPKTHLTQYWSGPALDRCLLLALVYPVATLLIVWHVTGQVGPLELALDLPADATGQERVLSGATLSALVAAMIWLGAGHRAQLGFRALMVRLAAFAGAVAGAGAVAFAGAGAVAVAGAVAGAVAFAVSQRRAVRRWTLLVALCLYVLAGSYWLFGFERAGSEGLLLLALFGVLPVVNAVFDWFSLGITRALLRRGQARSARASLGYATLDLLLAFGVLIFLTTLCVAVLTGLNARAGGRCSM